MSKSYACSSMRSRPESLQSAGGHSHATPLHQAALAGHESVARLLIERGARLDIEDSTITQRRPAGLPTPATPRSPRNSVTARRER